MYNTRLVIPLAMQLEVLDQLHQGHLGTSKSKGRAQGNVWWPLITKQIEAMVKNAIHACSTGPR